MFNTENYVLKIIQPTREYSLIVKVCQVKRGKIKKTVEVLAALKTLKKFKYDRPRCDIKEEVSKIEIKIYT